MTAVTIDHKHRQGVRKLAAVLAGLLVLGIATLTAVASWNDTFDQGSFTGRNAVVFSPASGTAG